MTITEFLLARIAEDEAKADEMESTAWYDGGWATEDAVHLRKESAAKRVIIEGWEPWFADGGMTAEQYDLGEQTAIHHAVQALAAVYSDHPDYQQEWRP